MSGECFPASSMQLESTKKKTVLENKSIKSASKDKVGDINEITEYETITAPTQKRRAQLKQIERINEFYNNQITFNGTQQIRGKFGLQNNIAGKTMRKVRQNSYAIATDTSDGPLGTISNILAGITKPLQILDFPNNVKYSNKLYQDQFYGVEKVKISTKSKQSLNSRSKLKFKRSKLKVDSATSANNFSRDIQNQATKVRVEKELKKNYIQLSKQMLLAKNKRGKRTDFKPHTTNYNSARKTIRTECTAPNPDLVEIYHNTAAKESKSSESDIPKKKIQKCNDEAVVPPLRINNNCKMMESRAAISCASKSYTLPTISSRMKQVAKWYLNSFSIKTIPFCLTTSTGPSHNIGINIQQVMNMVKNNQPFERLSPTLAYNIGLAASRKRENPLAFYFSSSTSRNFYPTCPLSRSTINYQQLKEVAKTITEETIEEAEENEETNSPETQSVIITGPSGDVKVTNKKQTVWTANSDEKKCTCVTPKGVGFQQIINKFNGSVVKPRHSNNTLPVTSIQFKKEKSGRVGGGEPIDKVSGNSIPIHNKEKKLKEVLQKLHDEFAAMTSAYEEVAKKCDEGQDNPEILKKLETLDKNLNSKEEEIIMVMSLYKEVITLKHQVKSLKERTSKENIKIKSQHPKLNVSESNITTAELLNKLLQRVQHLQAHYKKN